MCKVIAIYDDYLNILAFPISAFYLLQSQVFPPLIRFKPTSTANIKMRGIYSKLAIALRTVVAWLVYCTLQVTIAVYFSA